MESQVGEVEAWGMGHGAQGMGHGAWGAGHGAQGAGHWDAGVHPGFKLSMVKRR